MATKNTSSTPALSSIIADATASQAAAKAKMEALAAEMAEIEAAAASEQEAAHAALDAAFAPYREERTTLIDEKVEAITGREDALAPITAHFEKRQAKLDADYEKAVSEAVTPFTAAIAKVDEALAALEARVEAELGAPAVVFNMDLAPAPKPKTAKSAGSKSSARKMPKVADLGVIAAVTITAPHRYPNLDPTNPTTVQYEVHEVEGTLVLSAKRIDKLVQGVHVVNTEAVQGEYTHSSTVASDVATKPGWHSTKDVLYALATQAGILGSYPELAPESDASDILVNGEPMAASPLTSAPAEVTIEETV